LKEEAAMNADETISKLQLIPHPEGGHFRETFRDSATSSGRSASTAILYLLKAGERSHWHRVDATEVWHWHAGAPLELALSADGSESQTLILGPLIAEGQSPQIIVPATCWQAARSLGDYSLVGCTVAPGFEFTGFEIAPAGWMPRGS
jgi:predicted cupin superfamily sugar epimerase